MINIPSNCKTEAQKIVLAVKLQEEVRMVFNAGMQIATTNEQKNELRKIMMDRTEKVQLLRNDNIEIARTQNLHSMSVDNIVDGKIVFPTTSRPRLGDKTPNYINNESARLSALYGLSGEVDVSENEDFRAKLHQAKQDAISGHLQQDPFKWNPSIEDIV